jgi:hypothetical protein
MAAHSSYGNGDTKQAIARPAPRKAGFSIVPGPPATSPALYEKSSTTPTDSRASSPIGSDSDDSSIYASASPGYLPDDVYEQTMGWWRASIRRGIVKTVEWESNVIASMQVRTVLKFSALC